MKIIKNSGIQLIDRGWSIACDVTRKNKTDLLFVSHAHSDHTTRHVLENTTILSSYYTESLIKHFFPKLKTNNFVRNLEFEEVKFSQVSSGHTLGSTALQIDSYGKRVIYTGDVSIQKKGKLIEPFRPKKCDTLIIESTFGEPKYQFPPFEEEIKRAKDLIEDYLLKNTPVVLMGYPYGKAQILYDNFSSLSDNLILHESNLKIQKILESVNHNLSFNYNSYKYMRENNLLENKKPWILFSPLISGRNEFLRNLKSKYNARLFAFSGWCNFSSYKFQMSIDHGIIVSDHADFNELLDIVEKCNPRKVYTIYGSSLSFASELKRRGFNAYPLTKQKTLDSYL
ncbi:MAG: MBL fold metallo-hydrolase RNA specificity domain-containing protein [Candidatus Heimdallarchaeaceae archaeon]